MAESSPAMQTGYVDGSALEEPEAKPEPILDVPVSGTYGAEPAPNARLEKLLRVAAKRRAIERGEMVEVAPEVIIEGAPVRNAPEEGLSAIRNDDESVVALDEGAPIDGATFLRRSSRGYAYHVAEDATFGAELADGVSVVHVADLARETVAAGRVVVYPRPAEAPVPLQAVDPLQAALDPSDPSLVGRGTYVAAARDETDIFPRVGSVRGESPFPPCCGPTRLFYIYDGPVLGLVITQNTRAFKPGQTFQYVPLTVPVKFGFD
ncbi:MAG: hypothetical protein ACE363_02460 [Alphaproteobacteria bacterium]